MTAKDLKKLRLKLPPNGEGVKLISEKTGFSPDYVRRVLNKQRFNQAIIDKAIQIAADYQNKLKKKSEKINAL